MKHEKALETDGTFPQRRDIPWKCTTLQLQLVVLLCFTHTHTGRHVHTSTPTLSCILDLFMVCSCHSEGHLLTYIDSSVWVTRDGNATSRCPSVCSGVKIGQRSGENQWKNGIHTISNEHHGREQKVWAVSLCHVCCRFGLGKSGTDSVRKCINISVWVSEFEI